MDTTAALALVHELGWQVDPSCAAIRQLASAITSLEAVGADASTPFLRDYVRAASTLAEREVAAVPATSQQAAVRYVVVGTLFYEPVLLT